jgi:hypothetical protein
MGSKMRLLAAIGSVALLAAGCAVETGGQEAEAVENDVPIEERLDKYTEFTLDADLSELDDNQRQLIALLIEAGEATDEAFWMQAYGDREALMDRIDDAGVERFAEINYGPWDRLAGDEPFVPGVGPKPPGANFYPADMSKEEFEQAVASGGERAGQLESLYTMVRRDDAGELVAVPYSEYFAEQIEVAAGKLREAAAVADNSRLREYLELRAEALETDEYRESDMAWLDMKDNTIDVVIGPIETYEDQLFGNKAAFETFVLVKDREWSRRLARYAELLPALQRGLPVADEYKAETPGTDSDLNAYDAVYYAGDANAGSKTIAINLPNDEQVQLEKGTRRLQLKNAMRAKFDKILVPIADELIDPAQREHITFDAFFSNTMFHEVAHGLGIKTTLTGKGTVREALAERASAIEEGKADVLGLYLVEKLHEMGELDEGADLQDNYTTFLASLFRSIRFGASSAHGRANVVRFNYFKEQGAFTRTEEGHYRIEPEKFREAMNSLSEKILVIQGQGDYEAAGRLEEQYGSIGADLATDLERLDEAGIPVDVVFEQGKQTLGL